MMPRRSLAALLLVATLLGCDGKDNFPDGPPLPCQDLPALTVARCLDEDWLLEKARAMAPQCADLMVQLCYDQFLQDGQAFGTGSCDDYWRPCLQQPRCVAREGGGELCHHVTVQLFPTYLRSDGFVNPNLIDKACSEYIRLEPPPATALETSLKDQLRKRIEDRAIPPYEEIVIGPYLFDPQATLVDSASLPAAPPAKPTAGQRSLDLFPWSQVCTTPAPDVDEKDFVPTEDFLNPLGDRQLDISTFASCNDYALNKYYDWAVFQARMLHEANEDDRTPAILRVKAAYSSDVRGALGTLALQGGPLSYSYSGDWSVGPNKAFVLWSGRDRPVNLVAELLANMRAETTVTSPTDHRHRIILGHRTLASKVEPCAGMCPAPTRVTETWAFHAAQLQRYVEAELTGADELMVRLQRQQLFDLLVRRAQIEMAVLAKTQVEIVPVAGLALWRQPFEAGAKVERATKMLAGTLEPTLQNITLEERRWLAAHYASDFDATLAVYAKLSEAQIEERLAALDDFLTDALATNFLGCLAAADDPAHGVLCDWLPDMFTDRFEGLTEHDLLDLQPRPPLAGEAEADHSVQGPEADRQRCESYLRGTPFSRLLNDPVDPKKRYSFVCPLDGDLNLGGKLVSKFEVCGCDPAGSEWRCGHGQTLNQGSETYPVFYEPDDYRSGLAKFESFFQRANEMNDVAFAVATAFIPPCGTAPVMTEAHTHTLELGNDLFGAKLAKNYYWSKDGKTDTSALYGSFELQGQLLGFDVPFLAAAADAQKTPKAASTPKATVKVAGQDISWSATKSSGASYTGIDDVYYFYIGPIPCSVHWGVGGDWHVETSAVASDREIKLRANASTGAALYVEGGVDIGIAGAGLGVNLELFDLRPTFESSIGMRGTDPGHAANQADGVDLVSKFDLDTNVLSGRFYAWAEIGACPFCKEFDVTLFNWSGYHNHLPVWSRRFRLTEYNLDKLQQWSRPPDCQ